MRRAVALLLLLPVLAACGARSSGTAGAPVISSSTPTLFAPLPDGYPPEAFRVAHPMLFVGSGGPPAPNLPACTVAQIVAKSATIRTGEGVDGVIELDGPDCSMNIRQGPTQLLDANSHQLAISLNAAPPAINPPLNRYGDWALQAGHALWGFAVDGSWCETAPAFVVLPLTIDTANARTTDLKVPLSGPPPPCNGRSDAELRPGLPGSTAATSATAEAVLPPPTQWSGLTLGLHVDSVTNTGALVGLTLTIRNPSASSSVSLSPCPSYELVVTEGNGISVVDGAVGCSTSQVLPPLGSVTFPVDGQHFGEGDPDIKTGGPVDIQLAIAGAPTAETKARVG